jgi:ribosome-associated protein
VFVKKPVSVDRDTVVSWAVRAAQAADDKKGTNTTVIDVGRILAVTDMFVITSASNPRLVRALADEVTEQLKTECGIAPIRSEGMSDLTWVLLDYGDLVVHIFSDEMRAFYDIERLYRDAPKVSWASAAS